jgi:hypothetical protein
LGLSVIGGCSSGGEPDAYAEGVAALCRGACAGFQRCGLGGSECSQNCMDNYHPHGVHSSTLAVVGECLRDEDCETLAAEDAFEPCFESAAQAEPLRDQLLAYCESASLNYFRCNLWWSVEDCTHTMGAWDDAMLRAAMPCHDRACDDLRACEKASFEDSP